VNRPSFSRIILPAIAVAAIIGSVVYIGATQPDTKLTAPATTPATSPAAQRATGSVAGTGVVEPSSEIVEIAAHVPGVVARVWVTPGQQVAAGQPLLAIDDRAARAAVNEAAAAARTARASISAAQTALAVAQNQYALYQNVADERAVAQQEVITRRDAVANARANLAVAQAQARQSEAALGQAQVELDRHIVRAPAAMEVLQVDTRAGEFAGTQGTATALMKLGSTQPLHVRLDVDENQVERLNIGAAAIVSPRGSARTQVSAMFVRAEPLIIPKVSLTNSATERVDVRVIQLIYALPADQRGFFVGQQVDGFVPAKSKP
jgi:HlyD family secretion protein